MMGKNEQQGKGARRRYRTGEEERRYIEYKRWRKGRRWGQEEE